MTPLIDIDLSRFTLGEYTPDEVNAYIQEVTNLPNGPRNRTNNQYRSGSAFWEMFQGGRVMRRHYDTIGNDATGGNAKDAIYLFFTFPGADVATCEFSFFFPDGFCANTRAGKLPGNFASQEVVSISDINWRGFASLIMFHTDRDEQGNAIAPKNWQPGQHFTLADFTYASSLAQGGGIYGAKDGDWRYEEGGNVIKIQEGQWVHVRQVVRMNDYGKTNGYIRSFLNCNETAGKWIQVFNARENIEFRRDINPFSISVWELPIFLGGGDNAPTPYGWSPISQVDAYYKDFRMWNGEEIPTTPGTITLTEDEYDALITRLQTLEVERALQQMEVEKYKAKIDALKVAVQPLRDITQILWNG